MPAPANTQRHLRDLSAVRDVFPMDFARGDSTKLVGPFLSQVVQMVFPLPGRFRVVAVADPAVATDFIIPVPAGRLWKLIAMTMIFATDANVANREVALILREPGAAVYWVAGSTEIQTASLSLRHSAGAGLPIVGRSRSTLAEILIPLPAGLFLAEGHSIGSLTSAIQAGDQFSDLRLSVEELPFTP